MIISPDNYLYTEDGRYVWSPERIKEAWKTAMLRLSHALASPRFTKIVMLVGIPASGKSTWLKNNQEPNAIYFDATFKGYRARAPVIQAAKRAGKRIEAVLMDTPITVCLERNNCRPVDRIVSTDVVVNMAVRLAQEPPTTAEGFDKVTKISYRDPRTAVMHLASRWLSPSQKNVVGTVHVASRWLRRMADEAPLGGMSEKKRPEEFDRDELAKGMDVEMKENKDPHRAMQIAMRHMTEKPNYYSQADSDHD